LKPQIFIWQDFLSFLPLIQREKEIGCAGSQFVGWFVVVNLEREVDPYEEDRQTAKETAGEIYNINHYSSA
jgi:hypothetical protein